MVPLRTLALGAAAIVLVACGSSHVDQAYTVSSIANGTTCLKLPAGLAAKGAAHICDVWPPARIIGGRPLHVGDCVVLRLHPESSGSSQLVISDPARCSG